MARRVPARDGDKIQARSFIAHELAAGRMAHPNTIPCFDCSHRWSAGDTRHEHDHYLGYAAEHHGDVQVVCTNCHTKRRMSRGEGAVRLANLEGVTPAEIVARLEVEKRCSTCKAWKARSEFNKASGQPDGLQSACAECSRRMSRARRKAIQHG